MKQTTLLLLMVLSIGCSNSSNDNLILGNWRITTMTDLRTGEIKLEPEGESTTRPNIFISPESIIIKEENKEDEVYGWSISGDTLSLSDSSEKTVQKVFLKKLSQTELEVKLVAFFGDSIQLVLRKTEDHPIKRH